MYVVGLGNGIEHATMTPWFGHHYTLARRPRPSRDTQAGRGERAGPKQAPAPLRVLGGGWGRVLTSDTHSRRSASMRRE